MSDFIAGVEKTYSKGVLKDRSSIEGNVISCFFKDMLLLDESTLTKDDFITKDGRFYFSLLKHLRDKGFYSLDDVTIVSNCSEELVERYEERGGWSTIENQVEIINEKNFDIYLDNLFRENIFIKLEDDGFNLNKQITINNKKTIIINYLRKLTAEEVIDWFETKFTTYGTGYSSQIIEEEEIDFEDGFFESCKEGLENGVPFDIAGYDVNGEKINAFSFLSNQINGLLPGTLTMLGGFSSAGKSTWLITMIMALIYRDRKVLIISNEETIKKYKIKIFVWLLAKYKRYYKITKKKMMSGDIYEEDKKYFKEIQDYWRENYKGKIKFVVINDSNMSLVKKKIRENVLKYRYDTVLYDTFKIQAGDFNGSRQDLALVRDSRELDKIAKKYNIIMLASVQLAEYMRSRLFLTAEVLSNAKQIKEILENLFLMRNVYDEELDQDSKLYCKPFVVKKVDDKWVEEPFECDRNAVWRMLFVEKCRSGVNSSDNGIAYLLRFSGDHAVFREVAQCRPKHGEIH